MDDFIKRLEFLMDNYTLNASAFADKIGVQRSSISHLLSGRNKPSLDFVLKIQEFFPEVNLYWILNGKEKFLKSDQKQIINTVQIADTAPTLFTAESVPIEKKNVATENNTINSDEEVRSNKIIQNLNSDLDSQIFKIVIFYKDGTFKDFIQG